MIKYLRLLVKFYKTSFIADIEYRANFSLQIVADLIWYSTQIIAYEVIFQNTQQIGDWNLAQTRVFTAVVFLSDSVFMLLFSSNFEEFSENVSRGHLDLILAKPVNSQFMISLRKMSTAYTNNIIVTFLWLLFCLYQLPNVQWLNVFWLILFIPISVSVAYSTRFLISTTSIIFTRSESLHFIWFQLYRLGLRPDSIYQPRLRYILLTFFPMAFIASVPTRMLIEPFSLFLVLVGILIFPISIFITHKFWNFALKYYSSASS